MPKTRKPKREALRDTHVYLEKKDWDAVEALARRERRSVTNQITIFILKGLAAEAAKG